LAAALTLASAPPASAQGFFESLFGGLRRAVSRPAQQLPANIHAFSDPFTSLVDALSNNPRVPRGEVGPSAAYCVRSCDGHYFPVQAHANLSAADMCRAFCPAAQTRLYSGGGIDNAVASDGTRYADSPNAFVYRQKLVDNCTCNGRDAFGLANIDVATDPTLRPGDIVATKNGLTAFVGGRNSTAQFTPIQSYPGLPKTTRDKLADTRIMPGNAGAPHSEPVKLPLAANSSGTRDDDRRRVQLSQ
jgi:hypothetical protein